MINIYKIAQYQLYLLQLENYELRRFWKLLWQKGVVPFGQLRKGLVWTGKAASIFVLGQILLVVTGIGFALFIGRIVNGSIWIDIVVWIIVSYLLELISFVFFTVAIWLLWPLDAVLKKQIVNQAKARLKGNPQLTVIAIAGSFGKTTMKEVLKTVLSSQYSVLSTPDSVNTPVGIARFILQHVTSNTKILIAELGEHYEGDIQELCEFLRPDISVITGINEAHLERFENLDITIATIFEAVRFSKNGAAIVLNADSAPIIENYQKYTADKKVLFYSSHNNPLSTTAMSDLQFNEDALQQSFVLEGQLVRTLILG